MWNGSVIASQSVLKSPKKERPKYVLECPKNVLECLKFVLKCPKNILECPENVLECPKNVECPRYVKKSFKIIIIIF